MFTFCWENKFLIGQSTKKFSVKTGFEELEKKVNKLDGWYFGPLVAICQNPSQKYEMNGTYDTDSLLNN